ncbi:carboxypeptidase B-like isoform X2 [Brevipalpus obovatus]|uniref:carboxypeptidase B-like isoform X2 n=1 Tax=Brevipalpus obovatus TaxID=246614 RepID=UPI003D9DBCB9
MIRFQLLFFTIIIIIINSLAHALIESAPSNTKYYEIQIPMNDSRVHNRVGTLIDEGQILGPDRIFNQTLVKLWATENATRELQALAGDTMFISPSEHEPESRSDLDSNNNDKDSVHQYIRKSRPDFFTEYRRYQEMTQYAQELVSSYPNLMSLETFGKSFEGRDLILMKIGSRSNGDKPIIWIDAGIHAREWIASTSAFYIASQLPVQYHSDPIVKQLMDHFDFYIAPMVNPDGYEYTHTTNRFWRKTRSNHSKGQCVGVDANRNFGFKWMVEGASNNPCAETYAGPKAFSEPETQAIRDYLLKFTRDNGSQIRAYLTFHCFSEQWLYPWGYNKDVPPNGKQLEEKAKIAVDAMGRTKNKYLIGPSGKTLYPAAGGSDDWALAEAKINYAYTIELSPGFTSSKNGFVLPPQKIIPVSDEIFKAVKAFSKSLRDDAEWR